ncbi:hypothetical protein [Nonomuraea sp. NPDC050310]|uniref:hypothetical protein n=1 Tax=unclassified Nonomuraea TaxID=2593643 RepID=UPI0033C27F74
MKIKATLLGACAALALAAGFTGLSGPAAANPSKPAPVSATDPAPAPAEKPAVVSTDEPAPAPAESRPSAAPGEPVVANPSYTG